MKDTKRMEMIAENLIAHFLQRHGFLVAKPFFDEDGGDLFAITTEGGQRFGHVQCKGRSLLKGQKNKVEISVKLDLKSIVVCLFIDDGSFDSLNLYAFFKEDIENKWVLNPDKSQYVLSLSHTTFATNLKLNKFTEHTIDRISNTIMNKDLPTTAHFKYVASGGPSIDGTAPAKDS